MEPKTGWTITISAFARTVPEAQEISDKTLPDLEVVTSPYKIQSGRNKGLFGLTKRLEVTDETKDAVTQDLRDRLRAEPRVVDFMVLVGRKSSKPYEPKI